MNDEQYKKGLEVRRAVMGENLTSQPLLNFY